MFHHKLGLKELKMYTSSIINLVINLTFFKQFLYLPVNETNQYLTLQDFAEEGAPPEKAR